MQLIKQRYPQLQSWLARMKPLALRFFIGMVLGSLALATAHHPAIGKFVLIAFKLLVGFYGVVAASVVAVAVVAFASTLRWSRSSRGTHAGLRGTGRKVLLDKFVAWASNRAKAAAFCIDGVALVATLDQSRASITIAIGATWFYALSTFLSAIHDQKGSFADLRVGMSAAFMFVVSFWAHLR